MSKPGDFIGMIRLVPSFCGHFLVQIPNPWGVCRGKALVQNNQDEHWKMAPYDANEEVAPPFQTLYFSDDAWAKKLAMSDYVSCCWRFWLEVDSRCYHYCTTYALLYSGVLCSLSLSRSRLFRGFAGCRHCRLPSSAKIQKHRFITPTCTYYT